MKEFDELSYLDERISQIKTEKEYLLMLYDLCLKAKYVHVENSADYAIVRRENTLYLLFQWSDGKEDWKNNFDFVAVPYKDMDIEWRCHRGFLRVWKSIEPYVADSIMDASVKQIVLVGYSHGGAIATLAHEYVWFHRPDLRSFYVDNGTCKIGIEGFGFGCPRVFYGKVPKELKKRWRTFFPIRNLNDIVTHVPPAIFGFRHVESVLKIGEKGKLIRYRHFDCVSAHYPENYRISLGADKE